MKFTKSSSNMILINLFFKMVLGPLFYIIWVNLLTNGMKRLMKLTKSLSYMISVNLFFKIKIWCWAHCFILNVLTNEMKRKKIKKGHPALTIPLTIPLIVCVSTEVKIHVEVPKYPFNDWFGFFGGGAVINKYIKVT